MDHQVPVPVFFCIEACDSLQRGRMYFSGYAFYRGAGWSWTSAPRFFLVQVRPDKESPTVRIAGKMLFRNSLKLIYLAVFLTTSLGLRQRFRRWGVKDD
jgi:hypothetical protein